MALKLTVTPSTQYIEDSINIKITGGTIPRNSRLLVGYYLNGDLWHFYDEYIVNNNYNIYIDFSYSYENFPNTSDVSLAFDLVINDSVEQRIKKAMKIKPEPPTFDSMPTYEVITNPDLNFTNDNQMIVRGRSRIAASNIDATAYKAATLDKIIVNDSASISYARAQELIQQKGYFSFSMHDTEQMDKPYLFFDIVDSRGLKTRTILADISKFKYSYQKPIIKNFSVERDGISEVTILKASGYYSVGYQESTNILSTQYVYKENVEGSSTNVGQTTLTITKTPTQEYEDFVAILDEYNTPTYQLDENNLQYYDKQTFENGIDDLFSNAILYNDNYTQEYLQSDYDSVNERYYCKSGGYNGNWHNFWKKTLEAIYAKMYGDNTIYLDKFGDENGGNYEFEIEAIIQGDTQVGFSIDKVFNITLGIKDSQTSGYTEGYNRKTVLLPTAIPAIDVYKSNVAIHGLYDENLGGTQINGNLFLNGEGLFEQKILWEGAFYMRDIHTITLSKNVSDTKHGIVLVWSDYNGSASDSNFFTYYIPKEMVALHNGAGYFMSMGGTEGIIAYKYVYVGNKSITGHANNSGTHSQGGLSYNNSRAVLRYVIEI